MSEKVKRAPVNFDYQAINPDMMKGLAMIAGYAAEKYGSWDQYLNERLVGEKSPINHAYEHLRAFVSYEPYDHFDGHPRWHLIAAIYNLMMELGYHDMHGELLNPIVERRKVVRRNSLRRKKK